MRDTITQFNQHNCLVMAAGMSFFGIMSLIPLVLLGVSALGYVLRSSDTAQQFMTQLLSKSFPRSSGEILKQINVIIASPERALVDWLALLGLIWSGMNFFGILQRVLNSIWIGATQRQFIWGKITAFLIFVAAGMFFWASFVISWLGSAIDMLNSEGIALSIVSGVWLIVRLLIAIIAFAASTIMIFLVYSLVPHGKVSLKAAYVGSVFATVLLDLSKWFFNFVMMKFDVYGRVYGPLAGIIIFISWLYLSMGILLLGAELGSQCQKIYFYADRWYV